jgi:hypothetical protein
MRISPLWKEGLVERLTDVGGIICTVDFGIKQELIEGMEAMWVPLDCKHEFFVLDIGPRFAALSPLVRVHIRRGPEIATNRDSSPVTRWLQLSFLAAFR